MSRECSVLRAAIQDDASLVGASDPPVSENAVLAMVLVVLVVQAAMFVKDRIFGGTWRQQWQRWPHMWASFSSRGARDEGVDRWCRLWRQRSIATAFEVFMCLQSLVSVNVCFNLMFGKERLMSFAQTVVLVAGLTINLGCRISRSRRVEERPWIVYSLVMAQVCLYMWTCRPELMSVMFTEIHAFIVRACFSLAYPKAFPVIAWNLLYTCAGAYICGATCFQEFGQQMLSNQVGITVGVLFLSGFAARAVETEARREVKNAKLQAQSSGLWRLLDMFCDVVVSLDGGLRIDDPAVRFSAMMTLQGKDLEGMRLQDFMPELEDQQRFEEAAIADMTEASNSDATLPRALHVKLRDSLGNIIKAELFCVAVPAHVRRGCIVGIREFSDSSPISECVRFPRAQRRRAHEPPPASGCASDSGSECSGASGAARADAPRPRMPLVPTSGLGLGVEMALVQIMHLCVEPGDLVASGACCPFHSRVEQFTKSLGSFAEIPCVPDFRPKDAAWQQCRECGFLADKAPRGSRERSVCSRRRCFACEAQLTISAAPPPAVLPL